MGLPKIDVPTFKLKIPGTEKTYKFRPFLVKEGNILTQASASNDLSSQFDAVVQIVTNCCLDDIDVKELALYELQWLFIQLKGKSIGEEQEFVLSCGGCKQKLNYTMNIHEFEVFGSTDNPIMTAILNETSGIVFKIPTAEVHVKSSTLSDLELVVNCLVHVFSEDEIIKPEDISTDEMTEFIENLPLDKMTEITEYFSNIPMLGHRTKFNCTECGKANAVAITGLEHFFA